ncbi:MAG TPA: ribonuclease E inhibitor RraB [Chryseosolibacter sp.]|nr:ribonuclease E inhibitor RraB [Chryseosolibacter sp.]
MPARKIPKPKNRKQAPREKIIREHTAMQMMLAARVVEFVNASPDHEQEVDFFFYADSQSAARRLATALKEMEYNVSLENHPGNDGRFFIGGMTKKMKMDDRTLQLWTEKMCGLAERYDCFFDGWGTVAHMGDDIQENNNL